jgi:2-polyprenyl-3-methyl-5-hydroxy-6-metoxy-1,4-benzoquinol methylase
MDRHYVGTELELFAGARNWKAYWAGQIAPHLGPRILDVGAGLGATAATLAGHPAVSAWTCLEPDPRFARLLEAKIAAGELPASVRVAEGTLADHPARDAWDTILYIDVLEHIRKDRDELARAAEALAPGGKLIVLSPAHPVLFSPFDAAIGHERRYTRQALIACNPPGLRVVDMRYLDSVGLAASLANRLLLRQSMPTQRQIDVWDRLMVPASRALDPLFGFQAGKSILAVWSR